MRARPSASRRPRRSRTRFFPSRRARNRVQAARTARQSPPLLRRRPPPGHCRRRRKTRLRRRKRQAAPPLRSSATGRGPQFAAPTSGFLQARHLSFLPPKQVASPRETRLHPHLEAINALKQEWIAALVLQERDFGVETARPGIPAKAGRRQHTVTGDDHRDGIGTASPADRLTVGAELPGYVAIGAGL